jgi:hypothetical protein
MKILLDKCVAKRLKNLLPDHEVHTVVKHGWSGLKNGQLISSAINGGFDLFLTIDKNLQFQQNIKKYDIIVVIFDSPSSDIEDLEKFIPAFNKSLALLKKGNAYLISI